MKAPSGGNYKNLNFSSFVRLLFFFYFIWWNHEVRVTFTQWKFRFFCGFLLTFNGELCFFFYNFFLFFFAVGEIMRRLLSCVCGRVCRDHSDDDGRAHEPVADTARVRLQRPRPILHLLHRLITQRPNSRLRLQSSHRLYARSRWDSKTANCNKTFSFHPQCQE